MVTYTVKAVITTKFFWVVKVQKPASAGFCFGVCVASDTLRQFGCFS